MAIINLNDTTPPAPGGKVNIKWQADELVPRNVSAYIDPSEISSSAVCETPAGTLDGSNQVFTLSFTPKPGSLLLALNGVAQDPGSGSPLEGEDYTIAGLVITYAIAPKPNDSHTAWYTTS
jgi:hypothetical protein